MQTRALTFECEGSELIGLADLPAHAARRGLVIVVGGPQYRVGSHRQFALLARSIAAQGTAVFRFDHRGIGDSAGAARGFDDLSQDIRCAIDAFQSAVPTIESVALWGLCDAASAAMMYAASDERVDGMVLLNPWARSEAGLARSYLKHYYLSQLLSLGFWRRLVRGEVGLLAASRSFLGNLGTAVAGSGATGAVEKNDQTQPPGVPFQERMKAGLRSFKGQVLMILSGDDLTAREFEDMVKSSRSWRRLLARSNTTVRRLEAADHSFSTRLWRRSVEEWTDQWLKSF